MPRPLDAITRCGYVLPIDVCEDDLNDVVDLLGISDSSRRLEARSRIYRCLEDFNSARIRTVRAKTMRRDRSDLKRLEGLADSECAAVRFHRILDGLESLRTENPVLRRRLDWRLPRRHVYRKISIGSLSDCELDDFVREIQAAISAVQAEIDSENGQGRPTDYAALSFTSRLLDIWKTFTGRGTSRQYGLESEKNPFGDFVEKAGRLIFPDFKGRHFAREIHEARQAVTAERGSAWSGP